MMNNLQAQFEQLIAMLQLPAPVHEYRFHPVRKFRFDLAWPDQKVALEIDGGVWGQGRHNRPMGYIRDAVKGNLAAFAGWRVFHATPDMLQSGTAVDLLEGIKRLLKNS